MTSYDRFAPYYDAFYEPIVDYEGDVAFLQECFRRFAPQPRVGSVLDLGCGTGAHAQRLARAGFDVTGVDLSRAQLDIARAKVPGARFVEMDFTEELPDGAFDAACCMFAAWCYATSDEQAGRLLDLLGARLAPGALFVFEFWNPRGLAMAQNWGETELPDGRRLVRLTKPWLDGKVYRFRMEHFVMRGPALEDHFVETHALRLRTPEETEALARKHGFEVAAFTRGDREGKSFDAPARDAFRVMCVSRRAH